MNSQSNSSRLSAPTFYRTLWRWHFFAGLLCIPFIFILSVSGGIYLFKPQIENWRESNYHNLINTQARASANQHIEAAISSVSGAKFLSYRLPKQANDAVRISVLKQGERYYVYINPFNLETLGVESANNTLIEWTKNLHGELLAGSNGSLLVELVGCWTVVLIITGLYLAWPQNGRYSAGFLYPRVSLKGRSFWKELHTVMGVWLSLFALFLIISGLPWTTVWGGAFKESRTLLEKITTQEWQNSSSEKIQSWRVKASEDYDLRMEILRKAESLSFAWPSELSISNPETNEWKLASTTQNRPLRRTAWINGSDASVIKTEKFEDKKAIDRIVSIGIAAHEGQLFGPANQALGLLTVLGLIALSVSGVITWLKRKPQNKLGAPPAMAKKTWPRLLLLPVLLLPMLLLSVMVIVLVDFIYKKLKPARQAV